MNQLVRGPYSQGCLSGLRLDQLIATELEGEQLAEANQHLQVCVACAARLAHNQAFRARFQAAPPPLRRAVTEPASRPRFPRWSPRWSWVLTGTLAMAAAALAIVPGLMETSPQTRLKGDSRLAFFVEKAGRVQRGTSGEVLYPGARVQFVYSHPRRSWLAVLSLDGAGKASVYFPQGDAAAEMPGGSDQRLPVSTILDEALGTERIFGLFCDAPTALAPIREMLARGQTEPAIPPGCRMSRLSWEKRPSQ